jgi:outer membrane scaffolding protein for murein synthesis (MipA/OmpV family)
MKIAILLLATLVSGSAMGADVDLDPIPDLPLEGAPPGPATEQASSHGGWRFAVGGGASYAPRYQGSASNRFRIMPLLDARYRDEHFFASVMHGVGYNFSDLKSTQYGVRIAPGRSRKESADPHLTGMGNIGFTPEAGAFFNQRVAPWYFSSGISAGSHGAHADLGTGIGFALSDANHLRLGVNLTWGDAKYNQTYFGVTPAQAVASGNVLTAYDAGAGVKDYAVTANWLHNFGNKWFSTAGVSYKRLTGSAEKSPLTQRSSMPSANMLVGYRF